MATRTAGIVDPESLSALVDGELGRAQLGASCDSWRADESTRATWHSYQLIGDVLRSDDLASSAAHDCAFLLAVRARLTVEPVVLAPETRSNEALRTGADAASAGDPRMPIGASGGLGRVQSTRPVWLMPSAMAAGFALVVGAFTVLRGNTPDSPATTVAIVERGSESRGAQTVSLKRPLSFASANGPVLRDARLDRYLEAHKQFSGSSVLGEPSVFLRSATVGSSAR